MYTIVRRYPMKLTEALKEQIEDTLLPKIKGLDGYRQFSLMEQEGEGFFTVAIFEGRTNAEATNRVVQEWQKERNLNLPTPEITAGDVEFHEAKAAPKKKKAA